jgi:hypothetical protein
LMSATMVTVVVPLTIRRRGGRKMIVSLDDGATAAIPTRGDPALVKALARAHRWLRMLEAGEFGTVRELAKAERVNETYICRVLRLTLLAPEIVEAIVEGKQSVKVSLPGLMKLFPVKWADQRVALAMYSSH